MDNLIGIVIRGEFERLKENHKNGANIHIYGDCLLEEAAYYNHFDIVKYLIENGADINSEGGMMSIIKSGARCNKEVNEYLLYIKNIQLRKEKILNIKNRIQNKK